MTLAGDLEYSVRVSDRARHVRLTVSARDGLVVVVPRGVRVDAKRLVSTKEQWARRSLERVAQRRALYLAPAHELLPRCIDLAFSDRPLTVRYEGSASAATARAIRAGDELVVSGSTDALQRIEALRRWLSRCARDELVPRTAALADAHGFGVGTVRITSARSRWGSCSAKGTISLNRSLMLLPDHLARAVIAHELAHTRIMNHSTGFWRLLESLDPDARRHRMELRGAAELLPAWLDA